MDRVKISKFALPVLIFLAIFVWMQNLKSPQRAKKLKKWKNSSTAKKAKVLTREISSLLKWEKQKSVDNQNVSLKWGRSPFFLEEKTGGVRVSDEKAFILELNGILWDESSPVAIINNEIVGIKGKVNKYIVIKIEKEKVVLTDGFSNFELIMEPFE